MTTIDDVLKEFASRFGTVWNELCEEWGNPPKTELRDSLSSFFREKLLEAEHRGREEAVEYIKRKIALRDPNDVDFYDIYEAAKSPKTNTSV